MSSLARELREEQRDVNAEEQKSRERNQLVEPSLPNDDGCDRDGDKARLDARVRRHRQPAIQHWVFREAEQDRNNR